MREQTKKKDAQETRSADNYLYARSEIPQHVVNTLTEQNGNKIHINTPRQDAHYKGRVLYNGETHLAQLLGNKGETVIVHRKADLKYESENLKWRDENKRLQSVDIQVHYNQREGVVLPWNREKEQEKLYNYKTMQIGRDYANKHIEEQNRAAFLISLEAALAHKIIEPQKEKGSAETQPAQKAIQKSKNIDHER